MLDKFDKSRPSLLERTIRELAPGSSFVWDFDGVIADSEPLQDLSYRVLAERRGWSPPEQYFLPLVGKTEEVIWGVLIEMGLPLAPADSVSALTLERYEVFVDLAHEKLGPTWFATLLVPVLAREGIPQSIVSNGRPDVIEQLLEKWELRQFLPVRRRTAGQDKHDLLVEACRDRTIVLEDNRHWLDVAARLGAITVGVNHAYNQGSELRADYLIDV